MGEHASATTCRSGKLAGWRQLAAEVRQLYSGQHSDLRQVGGLAAENRVPPTPVARLVVGGQIVPEAQPLTAQRIGSGCRPHRTSVPQPVASPFVCEHQSVALQIVSERHTHAVARHVVHEAPTIAHHQISLP
jgi:hypothetical protein